ncbi:MAG TPA: isoprenyl transferase [Phycisphaerae bacterium]|nr:isoprenyl transferase [Phycisphaerae bacterium]
MPISPEETAAARAALGVDPQRLPRHVAIIMDGNGRWARTRGLPRPAGHVEGAKVVRQIVRESARIGLEALTLYSFSTENWYRPAEEVLALMRLYAEYLRRERQTVLENNLRFRHLGVRQGLPAEVLAELDATLAAARGNTGMWLNLALNYSGRVEMTLAVHEIARRAVAGEIELKDIDERTVSGALDTAGLPDPDLLIRTAGEMRISNFLLWQISYAEMVVTEVLWPDFDQQQYHKALRDFAGRHRRFGRVPE